MAGITRQERPDRSVLPGCPQIPSNGTDSGKRAGDPITFLMVHPHHLEVACPVRKSHHCRRRDTGPLPLLQCLAAAILSIPGGARSRLPCGVASGARLGRTIGCVERDLTTRPGLPISRTRTPAVGGTVALQESECLLREPSRVAASIRPAHPDAPVALWATKRVTPTVVLRRGRQWAPGIDSAWPQGGGRSATALRTASPDRAQPSLRGRERCLMRDQGETLHSGPPSRHTQHASGFA